MEQDFTFIVSELDSKNRIDKFLSNQFHELSRSFLQQLIDNGNVTVDGNSIKSNYKLKEAQEIHVMIPPTQEVEIIAEDIPLDIIYEDSDLLIINKPKGLVVHPSAGHESGTLVNAILHHCPNELSGINGEKRPGIVHRIDMDTTGSLIICKNDYSHQRIAEQIAVHSVTRIYEGIVSGIIKEDEGTIESLIGRNPNDRKKMAIVKNNGKKAITHFCVIERFKNATYVQFKLETGRTHQIRVHCASMQHPLLGDMVYGPSKQLIKGLEGQTLHAKTIGFIHPRTEKYVQFDAPLPEYFQNLLIKLRNIS